MKVVTLAHHYSRRRVGQFWKKQLKNTVISIVVITIAVAFAAWAVSFWMGQNRIELSIHGYIAIVAGAAITFGLGAGLMALSYYSHKNGFDNIDNRNDEPR